jgi:putative N6-adenine-specific DNA methylase
MHLKGFNESSWKELRRQARAAGKKSFSGKIIATDINEEAVRAARHNAATAGVEHLIEFGVCTYSETPVPEGGGVVVLNPEYGRRLGEIEALEKIYTGIGDHFKQKCEGYTGYIITGNLDLAKKVGLRTKRRIPFFNGTIECRLLEYELYGGSRRLGKIKAPTLQDKGMGPVTV